MNRDQALAKIKKCLALAASANPNEAASAMRQAQKMMSEHSINASDPKLAGICETTANGVMASTPLWEQHLLSLVTKSFGCDAIIGSKVKIGSWGRVVYEPKITFIGLDAAPKIASYAWSVLARQCAKDRLEHIARQGKYIKKATKTARGDAYAMGWVGGVHDKLVAFANPPETAALIQQYKAQTYPKLGTAKAVDRTKAKGVNRLDLLEGLRDGRKASLNRGVAGREAQGLLA